MSLPQPPFDMSATAIGLTVIATAITVGTITIATITTILTATIIPAIIVLVGITDSDNGWVTRWQFWLWGV